MDIRVVLLIVEGELHGSTEKAFGIIKLRV